MDEKEYIKELRRREKKLLERIEKMDVAMKETKEMSTLSFMWELLKEAKEELRMIQEKLVSIKTQKE